MFPTVAQVLELDVLRRGNPQVVAGAAGLEHPVRWVHISELADVAGMLRGGELVLTTGVMLPAEREPLARYIEDLADVGAAGLVVELGRRYADELPWPLVRAAERRGLPLVTLGTEVRFVAVTEAVHAHVVGAQLAELRASEAVHQTFNELAVEGAEPAEVVREVARMAGAPVVLENLSHQVLAFDPGGKLIHTIDLPCDLPTCCEFGGEDLDTLYVTTALYSRSPRDMTGQKNAGGLFAIRGLGVKGLPLVPFKG